jgi:hypothetical protein
MEFSPAHVCQVEGFALLAIPFFPGRTLWAGEGDLPADPFCQHLVGSRIGGTVMTPPFRSHNSSGTSTVIAVGILPALISRAMT